MQGVGCGVQGVGCGLQGAGLMASDVQVMGVVSSLSVVKGVGCRV